MVLTTVRAGGKGNYLLTNSLTDHVRRLAARISVGDGGRALLPVRCHQPTDLAH